ncbi:MAG: YciI family protein [Bacteroidia bacterium]|nr:YciI family protein [Bacteroidia bacterium]
MKQFLILLKGKQELDYSPEELQKRLEEYRAWANKLGDTILQDNRLEQRGHMIESRGVVKSDGPFLEAKEIIAGFIIIQADSLDHATQIFEDSPLINYFHLLLRPMVLPYE